MTQRARAKRHAGWRMRKGHRVAIDDMTARGCICRACDNKQRNAAYHLQPGTRAGIAAQLLLERPRNAAGAQRQNIAPQIKMQSNARRRLARALTPNTTGRIAEPITGKIRNRLRERKQRWQMANPDAQRRWRQRGKTLKSFRKLPAQQPGRATI